MSLPIRPWCPCAGLDSSARVASFGGIHEDNAGDKVYGARNNINTKFYEVKTQGNGNFQKFIKGNAMQNQQIRVSQIPSLIR